MRSSNLQTIDEPVAQWRPGDLGRVLSRHAGEEGRGDG